MDLATIVGIGGAVILVTGAAWPEEDTEPAVNSAKDWCLFLGAVCMLAYSFLNWLMGGPVFFVLLETFAFVAGVCMMLDVSESVDVPVLGVVGAAFVACSLLLFEGVSTALFVLGLVGIALGYIFHAGTLRRETALMLGSALIALFSLLTGSWIFFWLNLFFALFSLYYLVALATALRHMPHHKALAHVKHRRVRGGRRRQVKK